MCGLSSQDWEEVYRLAKRQGVTAVAFEKVKELPREVAPPKALVMKWMAHSLAIEKQTRSIYLRCADFAELVIIFSRRSNLSRLINDFKGVISKPFLFDEYKTL